MKITVIAVHGTICAFNSSTESWSTYAKRLSHNFVANNFVTVGKKQGNLLFACGLMLSHKEDQQKSLLWSGMAEIIEHDTQVEVVKEFLSNAETTMDAVYKL